jgi:hypothetical protein
MGFRNPLAWFRESMAKARRDRLELERYIASYNVPRSTPAERRNLDLFLNDLLGGGTRGN